LLAVHLESHDVGKNTYIECIDIKRERDKVCARLEQLKDLELALSFSFSPRFSTSHNEFYSQSE